MSSLRLMIRQLRTTQGSVSLLPTRRLLPRRRSSTPPPTRIIGKPPLRVKTLFMGYASALIISVLKCATHRRFPFTVFRCRCFLRLSAGLRPRHTPHSYTQRIHRSTAFARRCSRLSLRTVDFRHASLTLIPCQLLIETVTWKRPRTEFKQETWSTTIIAKTPPTPPPPRTLERYALFDLLSRVSTSVRSGIHVYGWGNH